MKKIIRFYQKFLKKQNIFIINKNFIINFNQLKKKKIKDLNCLFF